MKWFLFLLPFLLIIAPVLSQSPSPLRVGFMGDSTTDEYRGTDNRGSTFASVTFNWMEQLVINRGIIAGIWGTYSEPRRIGYSQNWARSASTAESMILAGQHTGLAAQVAHGDIDLVVISIGNHDFAPYNPNGYSPIYSGTLSDAQVTAKVNAIVANIGLAVNTLLDVRQIPIVLTTIVDFNLLPALFDTSPFPDPVKRQRVSDAVRLANNGIRALATLHGLAVFDSNALNMSLLTRATGNFLIIDGVPISIISAGDEPHNLLLGDHIHGGTVFEGLIANGYLTQINTLVDPDIPLFTNGEILSHAGLTSLATATPTFTVTSIPPTSLPDAAPPLNYFTTSSAVLTWTAVTWAAGYEVEISRNSNFTDLIPVNNPLPAEALSYTIPDLQGGTYYWRVQAVRADGTPGSWSGIEQITIVTGPHAGSSAEIASLITMMQTPTAAPTRTPAYTLTPTATLTPATD